MPSIRTLFVFIVLLTWCSVNQVLANSNLFDPKEFIQEYCVRCHGAEKQKGDRRFDALSNDFKSIESLQVWQEILDVINLGEMPPEDEQQASDSEVKALVAELTGRLAKGHALLDKESSQFRRLNRYEYLNTIRDLCGVNIESFDPTTSFPIDERVDGFENIGDALIISDYLFEQYLDAASKTIVKAAQKPNIITSLKKVFSPDDMCNRRFQFRPQIMYQVNPSGRFVDIGHGDQKSDRLHSQNFTGVSVDGYYTIRIEAEAIGRVNPYDSSLLGVDPDEPIKMEVLVADLRVGGRLSGNPTDRSVAIVPLKDNKREIYEFKVWMDKGYSPLVRYINGPQPIKSRLMRLMPKYHAKYLPSNYRSGTDKRPAEQLSLYMTDVYQGPRMRVYKMELEGPAPIPLEESSRYALLGDQVASEVLEPEKAIKRFLKRAFRRGPSKTEVKRYLNYYQARIEKGDSSETSLMAVFTAILCSPNFLFIEMPPDEKGSQVQPFRMASRLSYFLWSSMPDQKLLEAAEKGALKDPSILTAHVERMLNDMKSRAFTENFTDSWLRLNDLGSMPPDTVKFKVYYERLLQPLMKEETRLFFEYLLKDNLDIEYFIDSDFTFLNHYMADHYGVSGVQGVEFQKVTLPRNSKRGGILGHASVLTVTSNGVETSPVMRGVWILENILGTPPSPPPPDVEPLEPDIRGATTIREQLSKHRDVTTCAECHRKIDPLGFALEHFDPLGSYRDAYHTENNKTRMSIETAGQLATGEQFEDLESLKGLLIERKHQFAKCLTEKMMMYALGRELGFSDRPHVDSITTEWNEKGHGLRDLVKLIVLSEVFQKD